MTQGQYGIGLLGFWSLGEILEVRTAMPGQRVHRLVLHRDRADYRIEPLRGRLDLDETWTEIVVVGLHREAQTALIGRRAADYLASELRGQLLARSVELIVEDRMSRGRAQKVIQVRPPRFLGERLEGIGPLEIPGYPPVRFEIYLAGEQRESDGEPKGLALYSAGTLVAESFHDLAGLGLDRAPWTDTRLSGIVDFPALRVAPGSRRGVVIDETAGAFAQALRMIEPILIGVLDAIERRRSEEIDRSLIRDLQRAFRDFHRHRPSYTMLPVTDPDSAGSGTGGESKTGEGSESAAEGVGASADEATSETPPAIRTQQPELLPPGPLDCVKLTPTPLYVECRGRRGARARALDATGRPVEDEVEYCWSIDGPIGTLIHDGLPPERVILAAGDVEAKGRLTVVASSEGREARAETEVEVLAEIPAGPGSEGIPEPKLVHRPGAPWRSRMEDGQWEINTGHRDFRTVADRPALKLRYLAMLFAKEIVVRSHQDPRLAPALEQLVEVAAYADRRFSARGRKKKN